MIAIANTGGNYGSLIAAVEKLGLSSEVTERVKASHRSLILPGVGRADVVMAKLRNMGLADLIPSLSIPVLGICVGFHVMCKSSEEGPTKGMGIFYNEVKRLPQPRFGWEQSETLPDKPWFYFCHQYAALSGSEPYHWRQEGNFTGVQFHPEKSGESGLEFLRQWART